MADNGTGQCRKKLHVPQITRLAKALKQRGVDLGNDIYTVQRMEKRILEAHSRPCK